MIFAIAALLSAQTAAAPPMPPAPPAGDIVVCGRSMSYEDQACGALQAGKQWRFEDAAKAFETAARYSVPDGPKAARAYAAAGNMWISANQPGKAALALDRALAGTGLQAEQRGLALLDRARAAEAQNDLKTARAKVEEAKQTIADDPFLWYFSAALAIREGDKAVAQAAINQALTLAPADPTILFEAGHVAHFAGDLAKARDFWTRAAAADPQGASGKAAAEALALLDKPVQNTAGATK